MAQTVSDFFWQRLHEWGVRRVFGYPGDGIGGLIAALARVGDKIEFVQARHEEMAAFMASAHAKFTGEVGVCLATSGPGATHLITGMYDAHSDHMPMLAIMGQAARPVIGAHYQQELDLQSTCKDVAGAFVQTAMVPQQVQMLVDRAMRIAMGERRVTALIFPKDLQEETYEAPPHKHNATHTGAGYTKPKVLPYEADLRRAADVLNAGKKVAMLIGAGTFHAADEVIAVADRLGAGCAKALLGKMALPDDLPWVTGCIGLLGTKPSITLMDECDTLFMVGSGFPWAEFLPKPGNARGVQIDIKPAMLSLRYPMEVPLVGDSAETLRALLPLLEQKTDTSWRDSIAKGEQGVGGDRRGPGARVGEPGKPAAPVPRGVQAPAGERHPDGRFRDHGGLVCARHQGEARHDGVALGQPRQHGGGDALRHRREVRPSRPARDHLRRRWRHADEQPGRAADGREVLAALVEPDLHLHGAEQPGPEPSHLGGAGRGSAMPARSRRRRSRTSRITSSPS